MQVNGGRGPKHAEQRRSGATLTFLKERCPPPSYSLCERSESWMSRILVVFYSYTGTGRRLARLLATQQHWPLGEVRELRPRSGTTATWRCVLDSLLRRRPAIRYEGPALRNFDVVVLIAPIWVGQLASPMRSFVAELRTALPEVAVLSVMGSVGAPAAAAEIARWTRETPLLAGAFTSREVDDGSCAIRLQAFGDAIRTLGDASVATRPTFWSPQAA